MGRRARLDAQPAKGFASFRSHRIAVKRAHARARHARRLHRDARLREQVPRNRFSHGAATCVARAHEQDAGLDARTNLAFAYRPSALKLPPSIAREAHRGRTRLVSRRPSVDDLRNAQAGCCPLRIAGKRDAIAHAAEPRDTIRDNRCINAVQHAPARIVIGHSHAPDRLRVVSLHQLGNQRMCRADFTHGPSSRLNKKSHWPGRERAKQVQVDWRPDVQSVNHHVRTGCVPRAGHGPVGSQFVQLSDAIRPHEHAVHGVGR